MTIDAEVVDKVAKVIMAEVRNLAKAIVTSEAMAVHESRRVAVRVVTTITEDGVARSGKRSPITHRLFYDAADIALALRELALLGTGSRAEGIISNAAEVMLEMLDGGGTWRISKETGVIEVAQVTA